MPRKTTKAAAAVVSRDEARDLYLRIYDDFALVIKDADEDNSHLQPVVDAINARLDGSDQANGEAGQTIVRDWVNSDYEVWQCFLTYDSIPREVAEALFDDAWPTTEIEVPAPAPSTTVANSTCHCGCGEPTARGKGYKPGHDARHAGAVARQILAGGDHLALIATLPTDALRRKAQAQVERGNAKQATAKPAPKTKRAVKHPGAPEEGVALDGWVIRGGDLIPAQRGMVDGRVFLNINDAQDGSGDWLDSEGYDRKTQAYWLKRFVVDKPEAAPAPAVQATIDALDRRLPAKRSARKRGLAVGGDGPEALKDLFRL